jgi:hypothetical protein
VVSDVPVDDEAPLVTSGISRSAGAQSFGGAHKGRVCVRVFIGVSVRACCERLRCTVSFSKKGAPLFNVRRPLPFCHAARPHSSPSCRATSRLGAHLRAPPSGWPQRSPMRCLLAGRGPCRCAMTCSAGDLGGELGHDVQRRLDELHRCLQ